MMISICFAEAVLTSTHNLCYGAKIRKKVYPCMPQFYYIKVGYKGVYFSPACFPDAWKGTNTMMSKKREKEEKKYHIGPAQQAHDVIMTSDRR